MPASDTSDIIEQVAAEPAKAEVDGQKAENHPLPDLIALENHQAGKEAVAGASPKGGRRSAFNALRTGVFVPKGAV